MGCEATAGQEPAPEEVFTCRMCGDCCRGYGGTYLAPEDIAAIAAHVGRSREGFLASCCRVSGGRHVLGQAESGYCLFWDGLCTIHAVKPAMCRTWPFIRSVLVDVGNWHSMATCCPGMRTDVPDEVIRQHVRLRLAAGGPQRHL